MASSQLLAFPSGLYARGGGGAAASAAPTKSLDAFHGVVDAIAKAPATQLSLTLLHQLPRALAASQAAITLRERVTNFFTASNAADDAHAHFLTQLKTSLVVLQGIQTLDLSAATNGVKNRKNKKKKKMVKNNSPTADKTLVGDDQECGSVTATQFTNYYDVLRLPDDYFMGDAVDDLLVDHFASAVHVSGGAADRDKVWDEAFEHDLQLELACLLMEMEEMAEQVHETYSAVKRETRTLVEATAVAYAAILLIQSRVAALQLRYPSIREAQEVLTLLNTGATQDLHSKLSTALHRVADGRTSVGHLPGLFLADFVWVASALMTFTSAIPHDINQAIVLKDGYFGETYDEDTTPHYTLPDISTKAPPFFMQQWPLLYNAFMARRLMEAEGKPKLKTTTTTKKKPLTRGFWTLIDKYFTTQRGGIPVVSKWHPARAFAG